MKIFNFSNALKLLRHTYNLTQGQVADVVSSLDRDMAFDTSTVSRWEVGKVVPPHKKQIEIFCTLNFDLNYFKGNDYFLCDKEEVIDTVKEKLFSRFHWDFCYDDTHDKKSHERINKKIDISSTETSVSYLTYSCKSTGVILGRSDFKVERNLVRMVNELRIHSLYCTKEIIALDMIAFLIGYLFERRVDTVIYVSDNKLTPVSRLLKAIGFEQNKYHINQFSFVLDYYTMIYNPYLFYLALLGECIPYEKRSDRV